MSTRESVWGEIAAEAATLTILYTLHATLNEEQNSYPLQAIMCVHVCVRIYLGMYVCDMLSLDVDVCGGTRAKYRMNGGPPRYVLFAQV